MTEDVGLKAYRQEDADAALIFLHGFNGQHEQWSQFASLVARAPELASWDLYSLGYSTSSKLDFLSSWNILSPHQSADPSIDLLADYLLTQAGVKPLSRYRALTIVAHSMGGLVAQRAIVESEALAGRLSHLLLYGTPSNGLQKAGVFSPLKRQLANFTIGSAFITDLRGRWDKEVGAEPEFGFRAVAGDRDRYIPPTTSLDPFRREYQAVVPGDHLTMIHPERIDALNVSLIVDQVADTGRPPAVPGTPLALRSSTAISARRSSSSSRTRKSSTGLIWSSWPSRSRASATKNRRSTC